MERMNIVLYEPEIPQNTGNIGRSCVATGSILHLIEPLGFRLDDKLIRRAGMDYWKDLDVRRYLSYADFLSKNDQGTIYYVSTKGTNTYTNMSFKPGDYLMFGKESGGIPKDILDANKEHTIRIPMLGDTRSLNLSNSVSLVLYEALRQNQFMDLH